MNKSIQIIIVFGLILSLLVSTSGGLLAEEQLNQNSNKEQNNHSGPLLLGGLLGTIGGVYLTSHLFGEPEAYKHVILDVSPASKYGLIVLSGATLGSAVGVILTGKLLKTDGSEWGAVSGGFIGSLISLITCYIVGHSPIARIEYLPFFHIGLSFVPALFSMYGYENWFRNTVKNDYEK